MPVIIFIIIPVTAISLLYDKRRNIFFKSRMIAWLGMIKQRIEKRKQDKQGDQHKDDNDTRTFLAGERKIVGNEFFKHGTEPGDWLAEAGYALTGFRQAFRNDRKPLIKLTQMIVRPR